MRRRSGISDGALGQRTCANAFGGAAAVAYESGWSEGIPRFCTEDQGYQQGCQGAAVSDACPDTLAASYLDGYQSGYAVYMTQLEVDAMQRSIAAKSGELEKIWSELDALASNLEQSDIDDSSRRRLLEESRRLTARQAEIGAEIDELESEVGARKVQLTQLRHAIAISY